MEEPAKKRDMTLPASIIIAAVLVAFSMLYSAGKNSITEEKFQASATKQEETPSPERIEPVNAEDHIRGSTQAPVMVIEFSDFECPFCKSFHETMKTIVESYQGEVAWVFRHFPIDELHSRARREAEASECVASLGGEEAFWEFTDRIFEITPSNNGLDPKLLTETAEEIGVPGDAFGTCLQERRFKEKVESHVEDAVRSGGEGTPHSVIITRSGEKYLIPGAVPLDNPNGPSMREIIEAALAN